MLARSAVVLVCLCGTASAVQAMAPHGYWYEATPRQADEQALVAVLTGAFAGDLETRVAALNAFSAQHPGTAASGLAQLEIGLRLLAAERHVDAMAALQHPDLSRTAVLDEGLVALARAREAQGDAAGAVAAFAAAARTAPRGALKCSASVQGLALTAAPSEDFIAALAESLDLCGGRTAEALLALGRAYETRGQWLDAAHVYERLDAEHPIAPQTSEARARRATLASRVPPPPPTVAFERELNRARALMEDRRSLDAVTLLKQLRLRSPEGPRRDLATVRLAEAHVRLGRLTDAQATLHLVSAASPHAAEAAYWAARATRREGDRVLAYEAVASNFPDAPWSEKALLALARHYQKDALHERAAPYYRRLFEGFPESDMAPHAAWRVGWVEYRRGQYTEAAKIMEEAATRWSSDRDAPALMYWAGRAHLNAGRPDRARMLWTRAVLSFKHVFHGMLAEDALRRLPPPAANEPAVVVPSAPVAAPPAPLPEPTATRVHQYLLLGRREEALRELRALSNDRMAKATVAYLEARQGNLRTAITMMKRAYPEHRGVSGDTLPREAWEILYPLRYRPLLESAAHAEGLDPALVAGLICQESTFEAAARSRAGARGLMQIMPATGRQIARAKGVRHHARDLTSPAVSLDFGTHYLARMLERFGGRVERALAAYNAGPHRVVQWTAQEPEISAQEFIEDIPFTETRHYVQIVVTNQAHYRRIYGLAPRSRRSGNEIKP